MEYQLVEKPSFDIVGKALRVSTKDGENMRRIPKFWDEVHQDGSHDRLAALAARDSGILGDVILGICADFAEDMSEFTYMIAAEGTEKDGLEGMVQRTIPAATWAVFEAEGPMPDAIQAVWGYIWSDFFPSGKFKHDSAPDLEIYPMGDPSANNYKFAVWVPVTQS